MWADGALESFLTALSDAVAAETGEPASLPGYSQARERIADANLLHAWLGRLGLVDVRVRRHEHTIPLDPATAWEFVMGNAARGLVEGLEASARDRVRGRLATLMRERGLDRLSASFHVAVGRVPAEAHPEHA